MTALELLSNSTLNDKQKQFHVSPNPTKIVTPDISTPPQSPASFASTTLRLIQSQSLTSSTSSISSIDELEEAQHYQAMNLPSLDQSLNSTETVSNSYDDKKEIVVSILDDLISKQVASSNQEKNIELLKAKIQKNNQLLRENLKTSYQRFRLIQTKYFQTHVAQQLNNILELKEKQKKELNNTQKEEEAQAPPPKVAIDDGSVDLLTSILKSNLSDSTVENNSESVDEAVKSLLDDIQYEILKQTDEKVKNKTPKDCVTEDEETEDDEDLREDTTETNWKFTRGFKPHLTPVDNVNTLNEIVAEPVTLPVNNSESSKLTDSSNLFWSKSRAHLGSEWNRVQTKMKQLKMKSKQCNDYLDRTELFENYRMRSEISEIPTSDSENRNDQAAIAALSTSLQESIAAEVFAIDETKTETASRCLPYDRSNRKSRIFNLSRSDLVELDDNVLKSFYYTLRYFSNTYFKTMCLCRTKEKQSLKKTNYYYEKKRKLLEKKNCSDTVECPKNLTEDLAAADSLASRKTCIFCHLLKKYDQTRMETISLMNKTRQVNGQKKKKSKSQGEVSMSNKSNNNSSENVSQFNVKEANKNEIQANNSEIDSTLADINVVLSDHSYCKQPSSIKKYLPTDESTTTTNKKSKFMKTDTSEELLDKLVGERLKRIFDGGCIKTEKVDDVASTERVANDALKEEEFIDAGFDLPPDDLQNLPDLSYEELKFLNEMEMDKFTYCQRLENHQDDAFNDSDLSHSYSSYFTKKFYTLPCQMTPEIFHALNYKPKYRSLFNKKYREQRKHDKLEFIELKNTRKLEMKSRSRLNSFNKDKKLDNKVTRKDSISEKRSQTESNHSVRPRKRQRSTSSYSSNSSILSSNYNDSNYGDTNSNSPSCNHSSRSNNNNNNFYNYYCNNKFDIDNIVIPYDMVNTASKSVILMNQASVPTPRWRELVLEPLVNVSDEPMEDLDDKNFLDMHQIKEKKIPDKSKKLKASHVDLSTSMPANLLSSCLTGKKKTNLHEIDDRKLNCSVNITKQTQLKCAWLPRKFPLTESECDKLLKQDQP